jgi:cellulose synthase/poly-beta-1,6-N-acetylglucosamine synthase-like glycosyltransferase
MFMMPHQKAPKITIIFPPFFLLVCEKNNPCLKKFIKILIFKNIIIIIYQSFLLIIFILDNDLLVFLSLFCSKFMSK